MTLTAIWTILRALPWKWIGAGLILIGLFGIIYARGLYSGKHSRDPEVAALTTTIANMKAASAQATAANLAHVREVESHDEQTRKDQADAIATNAAAADDAVSRWIRLHPAPKAAACNAGDGRLPAPASATGSAAEADPDTVVPAEDLRICAAGIVTARGWQDWWKAVSAGE